MSLDFRTPLSSIDPQIVRAYDLRGRTLDQFTPALVYWIGRAIATQIGPNERAPVCVGADGRLSGPELKQALIAGLRESGADVIDLGYCATPVVYFTAAQQPVTHAVVLTASHNPADQNGLKLILDNKALMDQEIRTLADLALSGPFTEGAGSLREINPNSAYAYQLAQRFNLKPETRVIIDCANGISGPVAQMLFQRLNLSCSLINEEIDGTFPNHPPDPCVETNLTLLKQRVISEQADLGLAFDGDGDRVVAISRSGRTLAPDQLLILLATDLLQSNKGQVLMDAKCSALVQQSVEAAGGTIQIGRTGHSPMKRLMQSSGALCGGEFSAHYYFADWFGIDDAFYTSIRLIDLLQRKGKTLDQLIDELPQRISTAEIRLEVDESSKFDLVEQFGHCNFTATRISRIDGLRFEYPGGWGLVRASNTEPALVVRFEADSQDEINAIIDEFNSNLAQIGAQTPMLEHVRLEP